MVIRDLTEVVGGCDMKLGTYRSIAGKGNKDRLSLGEFWACIAAVGYGGIYRVWGRQERGYQGRKEEKYNGEKYDHHDIGLYEYNVLCWKFDIEFRESCIYSQYGTNTQEGDVAPRIRIEI